MKKFTFWKSLFLLCALIVGSTSAWADEVLHYTLDGSQTWSTSGSSGYATGTDTEQDGITWNVTGNTTLNPWGIGGKNMSGVDREVYSKTPMDAAITKVELEVGAASSVTVNSLKLIVASDENFANVIDEVEVDFVASSTLEFTPTSPLTEWSTDAYYKFVFNLTIGSSNKKVEFKSAKFYKEATLTDPTITFNNGSVNVGKTLDLSTLFTSNSAGEVTYGITEGGTYATLSGTTLTGVAEGSVTVQASQAAAGIYNAKTTTATITVNPAPALSSISITTAPTKTTYTEGETFDATGMVVTATYSDETTDDVTALCTWSPDGALATTDAEITVSYTENSTTKTATQVITVNEYVQLTSVTFDITQDMFEGVEFNSSNQTTESSISTTVNGVEMTIGKGNSNTYVKDGEFRCYKNGSLTFQAPNDYLITNIDFTKGSSWGMDSADPGVLDNQTWTAESATSTVTFGFSGRTDITSVEVTLAPKVVVTAAKYASYVTTQNIDFSQSAGVTAYKITAANATTLTMETIDAAPKGTPVILKANADTYALTVADNAPAAINGNLLQAGPVTGDGTSYYVLGKDASNNLGFGLLKSGVALPATKAYLPAASVAGARVAFIPFDNDATAVNFVVAEPIDANAPMYNLAGQRVNKSYKGVVIVNGKKMLNK